MKYDKGLIERDLRESLRKFPMYNNNQYIYVHLDGGVYIRYAPTQNITQSIGKTRFDLEIKGDSCDIIYFEIENKERENGYGSLLYDIIENFCVEQFNCKIFTTTPSGISKRIGFWERKGFRYKNAIVVEKERL